MANPAFCQTKVFRVDFIFFDQKAALFQLIFRGLPGHVKHFFFGPNEFFRSTVTIQAPFHEQRFFFPYQGHLVYPTVAGAAANPLINVDGVVKINKIRQIVNPSPLDGLARTPAFPNGLQHVGFGINHIVTVHADPRGRNVRGVGFFDRGVTVPAVNTHIHMMLVTEGDGLLHRGLRVANPGRPVHKIKRHQPPDSEKQQQNNTVQPMLASQCMRLFT